MLAGVFCFFLLFSLMVPQVAQAQNIIESLTLEGGPVASKHFQAGDENFHDRHSLAVMKVHTTQYGNWGLYILAPNSVDENSIGAGYVTDPYIIPLGSLKLELSAGLGLVSGYQDYPLPLLVGEAHLVLLEKGSWDAGLSMAALPYYMEDESETSDDEFGIVATTPFLSVRYNFNR